MIPEILSYLPRARMILSSGGFTGSSSSGVVLTLVPSLESEDELIILTTQHSFPEA